MTLRELIEIERGIYERLISACDRHDLAEIENLDLERLDNKADVDEALGVMETYAALGYEAVGVWDFRGHSRGGNPFSKVTPVDMAIDATLADDAEIWTTISPPKKS